MFLIGISDVWRFFIIATTKILDIFCSASQGGGPSYFGSPAYHLSNAVETFSDYASGDLDQTYTLRVGGPQVSPHKG